MHPDEIAVDDALVRRLLREQLPELSGLSLSRVASPSTANAMYRLGADLAVRLPRTPGAALSLEKEAAWLPRLAPRLPLATPVPVAIGAPAEDYPFAWSVCRWVPGRTNGAVAEPHEAAESLAEFVVTLRSIDADGGPAPGRHNFRRGVPLVERDDAVRASVAEASDELDAAAVLRVWDAALAAAPHDGPPAWLHGDLHSTNVLVDDGRISGVIDFGGLGVGDPACDVMAAWTVVPDAGRPTFRRAVGADDATWARARGWMLSMAVIALPYYRTRAPAIAEQHRGYVTAALREE